MKMRIRVFLYMIAALMLSACSGMPQLFWGTDGSEKAAQQSEAQEAEASGAPVMVSPQTRVETEMPASQSIGGQPGPMPARYQALLQDKGVSQDRRAYGTSADKVYSTLVDAMFSLNIPVDVVDSANGIITSDWVRKGENDPTFQPSIIGFTRHIFVVRVVAENGGSSLLEVYTIGQEYERSQWVDRPLKRKVSEELFATVEELLGR